MNNKNKQPRKDWRIRTWPSGTNVKGMKKIARRLARRFSNKTEDLLQGNLYQKLFSHYDICDFK